MMEPSVSLGVGGRDPHFADESLGSEKLTCWGWEGTWSKDP